MSLSVSSKQVGGEAVLQIAGDIDAHSSSKLRRELAGLFDASLQVIRVQLDGVEHMDSSGVATLSEGVLWSRRTGGHFILSGLSRSVTDVLELAKLDDVFEVDRSQGERV